MGIVCYSNPFSGQYIVAYRNIIDSGYIKRYLESLNLQKEKFIDRNFRTNKFYMTAVVVLIFAMIYTGNVVFLSKISATLVFAVFGISVSALWWMNVDSYNTLIKVKYANVIEKIEEKFPVKIRFLPQYQWSFPHWNHW